MLREKEIRKLFAGFRKLNIMVIGDVMVDSYLWGKVDRISSEAPIPIVALKRRENRLGGAANVAMNVHAMGAFPVLCTVIGTDDKGSEFIELLKKEKITTSGIIRSKKRITTTKFRIFGNSCQMLRVDEEVDQPLAEPDQEALLKKIRNILTTTRIDGIIFQDYDKGVITPGLIQEVVHLARELSVPVTVDPKKRNFLEYRNVTLFKPNLKELKSGLNLEEDLVENASVIDAVQQLRRKLGCRYVLTTMSEKGVMISYQDRREEQNIFIPAHLRTISDVSGAGDTVITVASLCLSLQCPPYDLAYISNLAGGLVCEEVGVVPVNYVKLLDEAVQLL